MPVIVNLKAIYHIIQDHFNYLNRIDASSRPQERSGEIKPGSVVMTLPEMDRDLYFVHDVLSITNNAGVGAWIHYHRDDDGWIDDAARAYHAIGHHQAADGILAARDHYDHHAPHLDNVDFSPFDDNIMCEDEAICRSLYQHLTSRHFLFRGQEQPVSQHKETTQRE
ncbi:hypothetical protein JIN85_13530 [Luteolibacter pohnpeiensis]|uniref:DNA mimic protein DMP19 C-terminal domain-containing protein n=1 Tax=Luteolibacter pohnpeiensis TaxID=454153 RepID=A0A934S746_9BACT|nr:hypothetical protein [Luteolibacter pohnpeiensis]MBK1883442.1 hypothetical protein [Luteolibacter pohnpeiensis]